jgi:hypothetical protein
MTDRSWQDRLSAAVLHVSEKLNGFRLCEHDLNQRGRPDDAMEWKRTAGGLDEAMMILAEHFPEIKELEEWR